MVRRKTPEQYYNECKEKGYDLPIEDYINAKTEIKHKCKYGHSYKQLPTNHLNGKGCPICKGSFKKTSEQYYHECKERGYDLPIEDYKGASVKIKHKCSKGHTYEQTPNSHLRGQGCSKCSGNHSYIPKEYYDLCKKRGLDLPIEDYISNKTKIKHRCNNGHIYEQKPYSHLQGIGCSKCSGTHSYTPKEYYDLCKEKGLDLPIEDYINSKTKIKHKCSKGHIYEQTPNNHLRGKSCFICKGSFKKTPQEYYNECKEKGLDLPTEDYINNSTKIKHKCNRGHIYEQSPDMHVGTQMQGCPVCNESHGERYIRKYLDNNSIKYIPQKKFHDLKDTTYLSYDFYLPEYNILIEYQGIQHYESNEYFGGEKNFKKQQLHDTLKKEYAKNNGYKLLDIKYTLNTQELVNKYLKRRLKR